LASYANAINSAGQVVGSAGDGSPDYGRAFLWTQGATDGVPGNQQMKNLGSLGGTGNTQPWPASTGLGINDASQVVGEANTTSGFSHAFLCTIVAGNPQMQDLGTLGNFVGNSIAYGINPTSSHDVQVVGESDTANGRHAFLWQSSTGMIDLGTLGGPTSIATGINDAGQVCGTSDTASGAYHAFLWTPTTPNGTTGSMQDLGTLGGSNSRAYAINKSGQVAGQADTNSGKFSEHHAFRWTPSGSNGTTGTMKDLGTLRSNLTVKDSAAYGINDSGHVVGTSGDGNPQQEAFYWPGSGSLQDLNALVLTGVSTITPVSINDGNQIAGGGGGEGHAWLLTPTSSTVQIGSFTASPDPVTAGSFVTLTAANITDTNPGATITKVAFYVQINGSNTFLGYGTQTSPGVWTCTFTVKLAPGTYTLFAQAEDSYGVFGDLAATTLTVQ
jgi:probable HAF family extracellular repeat protein